MAIALQGTPTVAETASATSQATAYPSGIVAGEVLLAHVAVGANNIGTTPPTGWTFSTSTAGTGSTGPSSALYYRVADGTESGSVTFPGASAAGRITVVLERWSGVNNTTPLDATPVAANGAAGTTFTGSTITTVTANAVIVHQVTLDAASAADILVATGTTNVADSTGTGKRELVAYETQATAGTSTARTWSDSPATSLAWGNIVAALRPTSATNYTANPADSEGITDSASVVKAQQLAPADSEGLTDTAAAVQGITRTLADPEGLTDTAAAVQGIVRASADPLGVTDAAGTVQVNVRAPAESVGVTDNASAVQAQQLGLADSAGITDAAALVQAQQLALADSVGITDAASAVLNQGSTNYTANPADPEGISDNAAVTMAAGRTVADPVGVTDGTAVVQSQQLSLSDPVGLTDTLTVAAGAVRTGADSAGLTDTATATMAASRTPADQAGITDSVTAARGLNPADSVGLTDSVSASLDRVVTVADTVGISYVVQQSGATRYLILNTQALQPRMAPAPLPVRWAFAALSRFALALVQRFTTNALTARFANVPLGGFMSTTIHVSKGEKQYAGGQITETTGKDISGATFLVSLGSADVPGTAAVADKNVVPPGAGNNVRIVAKLIDNTVALGHYWVWVHVGDSPENVLIPVQEIIVA